MQRCERCKKVFLEGKSEFYEESRRTCCPYCGYGFVVFLKACPKCKELHSGQEEICENCQEKLKDELRAFLRKYTQAERELMAWYWED